MGEFWDLSLFVVIVFFLRCGCSLMCVLGFFGSCGFSRGPCHLCLPFAGGQLRLIVAPGVSASALITVRVLLHLGGALLGVALAFFGYHVMYSM